jgi:hypothetical protein
MSAGAVAVAAAMEATKASGAIVHVPPEEFRKLLEMNPDGVLVHAMGGLFYSQHRYLMGYRGLIFHASSAEPVSPPRGCLVVEAKKIWIPG